MYESFYGFKSKPFQLNPDPTFYYGSRGHRRAMAYLEYGLHQSEGFIVITGDVGAGKTTLVRSLLQRLDSAKVVAAHLVSTQIDADDILRLVAASFGLPAKNVEKADLLLQLEAFLVKLTAGGKRALLIVDEAQNLTPRAVEELRMLSNFQLEDHALLQSFLVGQPEFRQTMQSEHMQQLRQRVIASYHLGPLDLAETRAYVEHRLGCVGWKTDPRFEPSAFDVIHAASGGIPRRINTLCDRVLLAGFLAEKHAVSATDVDDVVTEMRDESGSESVATRSGGAGINLASAGALSGLLGDPALAQRFAEIGAGYQASRLEVRIEQVERVLGALLGMAQERGASPNDDLRAEGRQGA
ncbi:XrtA-associated ATPase [Niveibacterium umoris]|uniref:Putative secretion ATPase (PEP-CTERM system associated) n=1 Tax=Niveibacterium umoris TaxID=1193620 RepID=A0A840BNC1_9RHOO|nr:XrtA/PEP-CTERM system-associated ATPase [Niveibacterium umoris]MBB4012336.1 putative secretion ATPase (PEP-CTERM system associated) [Niveibacterium umoris]